MTDTLFKSSAIRLVMFNLMLGTAALMLSAIAPANVTPKELSRAEKRLAAFRESFEPTGESNNCINTRRIRDMRIIDKEHILFRLSHGEYALNKLPRTCHSLRRGKTLAYAPISQRLCSVDTITVLDNFHAQGFRLIGPRCGLGQFAIVKKKKDLAIKVN